MKQLAPSPSPRAVFITGANAGIGRAAAQTLASRGHIVLMGARSLARGAEARDRLLAADPGIAPERLVLIPVDVADASSIAAAAAQIDDVVGVDGLDVLIHNAAFFDITQKDRVVDDATALERTWLTNVVGPARLTAALKPCLLRAAQRARDEADTVSDDRRPRIIAITSKGLMMYPRLQVELDDVSYDRRRFSVQQAYYQSKLAHLAWMLALAARVDDDGIVVQGVRVTNVRIDLERYPNLHPVLRAVYALKSRFSITPAQMAETYVWLAEGRQRETGAYVDAPEVSATVSRWAQSTTHQQAVWALLETQLGERAW